MIKRELNLPHLTIGWLNTHLALVLLVGSSDFNFDHLGKWGINLLLTLGQPFQLLCLLHCLDAIEPRLALLVFWLVDWEVNRVKLLEHAFFVSKALGAQAHIILFQYFNR